ncbi:MAG: inositol monophosphatase family protein [Hyphomonadaceae bacterium]|nr:inositol monophosphatase family protein [Hyphomonadaceae bacterium]
MTLHPRPALDDLIALAIAAGREIMAVREMGFEAQEKLDGSPVTIADARAEAVIIAGLAALSPGVPVIAEESVADGRIPLCGDAFYCVDPLDGTRDFIEGGSGEFTVNIALVERGAPIVGVIYAPATGGLWAGAPGHAVRADYDVQTGAARTPLRAIRVREGAAPFSIIASRRSKSDKLTAFCAAIPHLPAASSSSIKFCHIAEGSADLYPRFGQVSEWDAAAGHAILAAAGGGVMRVSDGAPLTYGHADKRFLIDGFVAYGGAASQAIARSALRL